MKTSAVWRCLPLVRNTPKGWLRDFLLTQRNGLTGHLEHAGYPFNTKAWRSARLRTHERCLADWWPYEQTAYWIDGMMRCGLLLDDSFLKRKARKQIDHVLSRPDRDGYLGPSSIKSLRGERSADRWPHTVFFRSVLADFDERPSKETLRKLTRHYLSNTARHETVRNVCNVEIMAWLYERTGNRRLRDLAEKSYLAFQKNEAKSGATLKNMLRHDMARDHGPTYMELFKLGAILYRITGKTRYLKASINAQKKLERDHVLIDGVPSATEHLRGIYSTAGHETCVVSDYLWSLGVLLETTGDARYADAMERAGYNALPGSVTPDFKALQYFSGPNQVIAGAQTNHHPHGFTGAHVSFRPNPATECCPGNVHRAMPVLAGRMWMEDGKGGIVAAVYGPSRATYGQGRGAIDVVQETDYPFSDHVTFRFQCQKPQARSFTFRIPDWSKRPAVEWNGEAMAGPFKPGAFVSIRKTIRDGDQLTLKFHFAVRNVRGPENSIGFCWGPLALSLPVREKVRIENDPRSSVAFPAWTMHPDSPWNYGILARDLPRALNVAHRAGERGGTSWRADAAALFLTLPARRVSGWKLKRRKKMVLKHGDRKKVVEGDLAFTPEMPVRRDRYRQRAESITLVPYGCTNLRVTWFPRLK